MKRIGVDIGGTFTDLVYRDDESGASLIHKLPSTPSDPAMAGLEGVKALCRKAGVLPSEIELFVHGTTVATNILLEHTGARVGLITTRGFRDILHIGRKNRPLNFSHAQDVPRQSAPLVPRRYRHTVRERISAPDGAVVLPLHEEDVHAAIAALKLDGGIEAVAICCLFSFLNPAHEQRIARIVRSEWPGVFVTASHEVVPLYREYERFSTTALNAAVGPRTASYIDRYSESLQSAGLTADLRLMTSAGGIISADEASTNPVSLLLSGPVGALVAGIEAGRLTGHDSVITLDVGGTSADIGVAPGGELRMRHLLDTRIGDYDAMVPMADIGTIGAGGGSIARIDDGGMFRVGPDSAGADPGPACYGHGGTQPTVTDAIVSLGWYRGEALRESGLEIDPALAGESIESSIAQPLNLSRHEAAAGIFRIAVNNMAEAIRVNSVARGYDPRDFALLAYGGAGAAFAVAVAGELAMETVIIPPGAGVGAAGGLLATDMKYDHQATLWEQLDDPDHERISDAYAVLREQSWQKLSRDGFSETDSQIRLFADCRYAGQGYELRVETPSPPFGPGWCEQVSDRFHAAHEQTHGRRFDEKPVMIVNIGVSGIGSVAATRDVPLQAHNGREVPSLIRDAVFLKNGAVVRQPARFIQRGDLGAGAEVRGPAVIEQSDTTTVLPPGSHLRVGVHGHLMIRLEQECE